MKKILLLILPIVLFFGFSFADTYTISFPSVTKCITNTFRYGNVFSINGNTGLLLVSYSKISTSTCTGSWLYSVSNLSTVLATGVYDGVDTFSYNYFLSPGVDYVVMLGPYDGVTSCKHIYANNVYMFPYLSGFARFSVFGQVYNTTNTATNTTHGQTYVFSGTDPFIDIPTYYNITSPLGTQQITQDITLTGNVSRDIGFPDYEVSSFSTNSVVYVDGFLHSYTGLNFNITDVDNVVESGGTLEIYNDTSVPIARTGQVINQTGDRAVVQSGNVFGTFIQSTTKMIFGNIGSIFMVLGSIFIIWLILKLFGVRLKSRKKTFYS